MEKYEGFHFLERGLKLAWIKKTRYFMKIVVKKEIMACYENFVVLLANNVTCQSKYWVNKVKISFIFSLGSCLVI